MIGPRSNILNLQIGAKALIEFWLLPIALAICFSSWMILGSLDSGTLSLPPTYDDIEYFRDAGRRLHTLNTFGIVEFFRSYYLDPPHAPLSTCLAMIGFSLFGLYPWAAIAMNSLFVFLLIKIFLGLISKLSPLIRLAFACMFLLHPYFALLVLEFRPDPASAILTALGCAVIIMRPDEKHSALIAGIFFGLALFAKPSIFFLTSLLFGVAFLLSSLEALSDKRWDDVKKRAWRICTPAFAIAGLHYAIAAPQILSYIHQTIWGYTSAVWKTPMPIYRQMATYLIGGGGRFGMGLWILLVPPLIFLRFKLSTIRSRHLALRDPITQLIAVSAVAWAFVSFAPIKSIFLGLSVSAFALVLTCLCLVQVCQAQKSLALPLAVAIFVLGCVDYKQPWLRRGGSVLSPDYVTSKHDVIKSVTDAIAMQPDIANSTVLFPISASYLNISTLDFYLQQRGIYGTQFSGDPFSDHPADYQSKSFDYLVEITSDSKDYIDWLPSGKIADQINDLIRQDRTLELLLSFPDSLSGGSINIYHKKS